MQYHQQFNGARRGMIALFIATLASTAMTKTSMGAAIRAYLNGLNELRVGMNIEQASQAVGARFVLDEDAHHNGCRYAHPQQGLQNVGLLLTNGRLARIDIEAGSDIKTMRGAGIGDSEDRIKSLYPGRIQVSRHEYTNGHYLTFVPTSQRHQAYRLIFETDGRKVVNYRVGKLPEVGYAEGCS
jgi:hypothetical protein